MPLLTKFTSPLINKSKKTFQKWIFVLESFSLMNKYWQNLFGKVFVYYYNLKQNKCNDEFILEKLKQIKKNS